MVTGCPYPLERVHPEIALAKKMVIDFALSGCTDYIYKCINAAQSNVYELKNWMDLMK